MQNPRTDNPAYAAWRRAIRDMARAHGIKLWIGDMSSAKLCKDLTQAGVTEEELVAIYNMAYSGNLEGEHHGRRTI